MVLDVGVVAVPFGALDTDAKVVAKLTSEKLPKMSHITKCEISITKSYQHSNNKR